MSPLSSRVRSEPKAAASTRRRVALVALLVATVIALVWTLQPRPKTAEPPVVVEPPAPQAVVAGSVFKPSVCGQPATKPFVPTKITVDEVATNAPVLALPRDANNVPQAPPLSAAGQTQFAWDKPTISPGSQKGNVLFNAHTYPDGSALGNRLLDHFQVGDRIIVRGANAELCYQVTKRVVIPAANGSSEYYVKDGPPQLALIVCSPPRLGPGNWKNRTIWYASPINPDGTV